MRGATYAEKRDVDGHISEKNIRRQKTRTRVGVGGGWPVRIVRQQLL